MAAGPVMSHLLLYIWPVFKIRVLQQTPYNALQASRSHLCLVNLSKCWPPSRVQPRHYSFYNPCYNALQNRNIGTSDSVFKRNNIRTLIFLIVYHVWTDDDTYIFSLWISVCYVLQTSMFISNAVCLVKKSDITCYYCWSRLPANL